MVDQKLLGRVIKWESDYDADYINYTRTSYYSIGTIVHMTPLSFIIEDIDTKKRTRIYKSNLNLHEDETEADELIRQHLEQQSKPKILATDNTPYDVYILHDDDDITHYVGITKDMNKRYRQHCRCVGTNLELNLWIQSRLRSGKRPHMEKIDQAIGRINAESLEEDYISLYLQQGMPLKNILKVGGN